MSTSRQVLSPVSVPRNRLSIFADELGAEKTEQLSKKATNLRRLLSDRTFWHVNSTATGGGVAEMLRPILGYANDLGIKSRWVVVNGTAPFFVVTKRIHNALHGSAGDGGSLGTQEAQAYEQALAPAALELKALVKPGDPVVLHDPQTAGLAPTVQSCGGIVIWRCHVGTQVQNEQSLAAWEFLRPYLESSVDQFVFTRESYAPKWVDRSALTVIKPSIDPVSPKNIRRDEDEITALLLSSGIAVDGGMPSNPVFRRADGSLSPLTSRVNLNGTPPIPLEAPLITQVSRWDRLKDMGGVMKAITDHPFSGDAHLALVGPETAGVSDDPEGAQVLVDCIEQLKMLPSAVRQRVTLASVPMDDPEENAAIVNAVQRHSTIVTQKSLQEGFGLTVTEAMFKGRAIVASKVGGIPDQVADGVEGMLLEDPTDLQEFASRLHMLLADKRRRESLGIAAEQRATGEFLMDRHLLQYFELLLRYSDQDVRTDAV